MKSRIVEQLGQAEILLPGLVAEGLRANDRAKVRLSVLQAAAEHARDPHGVPVDLSAECRSAGVDAIAAKALVAGARPVVNGPAWAMPRIVSLPAEQDRASARSG
jgi:hypothetical protein